MKARGELTFYEFFAGGGMARAGLGEDWTCLFANDISAKKAASYSANWGADDLLVSDIFDLNAADLPGQADLAWGSFPCQDLSLAGLGAGLEGKRSSAFWGFWKLIEELNKRRRKPRMVVLENVYGALTSHGGKDFETIIGALVRENYLVGAMVMDAIHFLPQSRPRLFIVGLDKTIKPTIDAVSALPAPAWHPSALIRAYHRLPRDLKRTWIWWNPPTPTKRVERLGDVIENQPVGAKWHSNKETQRILSMMTPLNRQKVVAAQASGGLTVGAVYRRTRGGEQRAEVRFDGIAGCLRTPSGGSSRQTILVVQGPVILTRLLSSREAARLMGLADDYLLPLNYNDAYHLAGDGVAVPVVAHLSKNVLVPLLRQSSRMCREKAA